MGQLKPGERLRLADGSEAIVERLTWEYAPCERHDWKPGEPAVGTLGTPADPKSGAFTTYNFEVEDWHTYFVQPVHSQISGESVWVHNMGTGVCPELVKVAKRHPELVAKMNLAPEVRAALQEKGLIAKGPADQYALVAVRDGWYPVMERGFKHPQYAVFLKEGEVWKYGKTINPATRYSEAWLIKMGLRYRTQYSGSVNNALALERAKIVGHFDRCGTLPPGNKVRR